MNLNRRESIRSGWQSWLAGLAVWTLVGLAFAAQFYLTSSKFGSPVTWRHAVVMSLSDWYVFAVLSVGILRLARRFPFERAFWIRRAAVHFAGSGVFAVLWIILRAWLGQLQAAWEGRPVSFGELFNPLLVKTFSFNLLVYWVVISVSHAIDYYRRLQERELRTADLERRLVQAKLQALQMQLNPHFLFNTLHSISALMHQDVEAADRMVTRLSELLRYALESSDAQEVPLKQELDFLDRYIEIQKTRFGDRLTVDRQIDPAALKLDVPNLILQPLVENAVRHGIEPHSRPGHITIRAKLDGNHLEIDVQNQCPGRTNPAPRGPGVGLANTRARLRELYGDAAGLELIEPGPGCFIARLTLPRRSAETATVESE